MLIMKANENPLKARLFGIILLSVLSVAGYTQARPDYVFKNSTLISGTINTAGSSYRFPAVKTGVDAIVFINSISTDVKIVDFDDNANGGFNDAFQPRIQAKGKTTGYAEFKITFVRAGTSTPMVQSEVPATSIDVDGAKTVRDSMFEYDEFMIPGTYNLDYNMVGTDLNFKYTAGGIMGKNFRGIEKDLIDTVAQEVMFTVIYPSATSVTIRIGIDNQRSGAETRQRSVYFKRFNYPNSFLPANNLSSFSGNRPNNNQTVLNWKMNKQHSYSRAIIEKSSNGTSFGTIGQVSLQGMDFSSYTDNSVETGSSFYRLKLIESSGKITYSTVVYIKSGTTTPGKINVFPSVVTADYANINYTSDRAGNAKLALYDQSGRLVLSQDVTVSAGSNTFSVKGLSRFNKGQYIMSVSGNDFKYAQQIQITK